MPHVIKIAIRDFGRIADAVIDLKRITIVAGPNLAGKTTVVRALEYGLFGRTIGLAANEARLLVRDGRERLRVEVTLGTTSEVPQKVSRTLTTVDPKQSEIDAMLPPRRQVLASLYAGQFAKMTSADRRSFLLAVVGNPTLVAGVEIDRAMAAMKFSSQEPVSFDGFTAEVRRRLVIEDAAAAMHVQPIIDQEVMTKNGLAKVGTLQTAEVMRRALAELRAQPRTVDPAAALVESAMEEVLVREGYVASALLHVARAKESETADDAEFVGVVEALNAAQSNAAVVLEASIVASLRLELPSLAESGKSCRVCEGRLDADECGLVGGKAAKEKQAALRAGSEANAEVVRLTARRNELCAKVEALGKVEEDLASKTARLEEARETLRRASSKAPEDAVRRAEAVHAAIGRGDAMLAARQAYETSLEQNRMNAKTQQTAVEMAGILRAALEVTVAAQADRGRAAMEIIRSALRESSEGMFFGNADAVQLSDALELKILDRDARVAGRSAVERAGVALAYAVAHLSPFGTLVIDDAEMMDKVTLQASLGFLARQTTFSTTLVCVVEADRKNIKEPTNPLVAAYWADNGKIERIGKG